MPTSLPIPGDGGSWLDNLRSTIFFGGSGGEGGADEDGCHPGRGGNGGGIIIVDAVRADRGTVAPTVRVAAAATAALR